MKHSDSDQNKFSRKANIPDIKLYISFIVHQKQYVYLENFD